VDMPCPGHLSALREVFCHTEAHAHTHALGELPAAPPDALGELPAAPPDALGKLPAGPPDALGELPAERAPLEAAVIGGTSLGPEWCAGARTGAARRTADGRRLV